MFLCVCEYMWYTHVQRCVVTLEDICIRQYSELLIHTVNLINTELFIRFTVFTHQLYSIRKMCRIGNTKPEMANCLLFCCCYLLLASAISAVSGVPSATYPAKISSQCLQGNSLQDEQLMETLRQIQQQLGPPGCKLPMNRSCQEILYCFPSAPSGYYQIHAANGSAVQIYCDMEGNNCGGEGGWMRVAYVNMTQPGATCPQGLTQKQFSGLTLCGRSNSGYQGTTFSTFGLNYSRVCGQLRGYQWGTPDAFSPYNADNSRTIDDVYVDGVSITYGNVSRKHIWTYANGLDLGTYNPTLYGCPCNNDSNAQVPPYVGSDYYCETGYNVYACCSSHILLNDTLWDGQQCVGTEAPCCTHPNMPWFHKTLNETTAEDIELRVCSDQPIYNEDTLLQVIELFVY